MFVVAGASGNTGSVVAETLLAQKKPVRVIVRDAAKGEPWKQRGAEVAIAELDDAAALGRALHGATGVYLLLPPQMGSSNSRADNAQRTQAYVKAIEASGVGHVVFLSGFSAQLEHGTGPILSLHDAEIALKKTRAAVTFVRAAFFMENWGSSLYDLANGVFPTFIKAELTFAMVAAHDVGTTAAKALVEGGKGHTILALGGPRDYSPKDVAAALSRVTGKAIAVQEGPEEAIVPALMGAGLNAHWAELYKELYHAINVKLITWEGSAARLVRGATEVDVVLEKLIGG